MRNSNTIYLVVVFGYLLSGCTAVELDSLVPSSALEYATPDGLPIVKTCDPSRMFTLATAARVSQTAARVQSVLPPELKNDAVVNTILVHSQYVASNSGRTASSLVKTSGSPPIADVTPLPRPNTTLTHLDFERFARVVSNQVLRRTPTTPNSSDPSNVDPFWTKLRAYYVAYYDGNFYTYFGDKLDKPTASLTITDTEIVQAATVFVELLMDEVFQSPIWIGTDKKYYPGGNTNKPTLVTVNNITPIPISLSAYGCGMNAPKANAIRYLSSSFSKAAATETSLTIKSAGSIEIGLGVVGKLNIGDNSTLTSLVQAVVSEIVGRLTVQLAAPILEAIDFEQQPTVVQTSPTTVQVVSNTTQLRGLSKAEISRKMTAPFVSGKLTGM
jgi:hypothetical protein